jgi:hypothetical protein
MNNHAHWYGGGIYHSGTWLYVQDSTVNNNVVHHGAGGGIYVSSGNVEIRYSTINDNSTVKQDSYHPVGAGIANGADDSKTGGDITGGVVSVVNSTISGNVADRTAGGILNRGVGQVWLKSVTITNNVVANATGTAGAGGVYSNGAGALSFEHDHR